MAEHVQCSKAPDIDTLSHKVDVLIDAQQATSSKLEKAINRLTSVIETDIETRAAVEQLKKDREMLFARYHGIDARVDAIEIRNAKCDGLGVFNKWDTVWNFIQQEKGWRRFIPALLTAASFLILLWTTFGDKVTSNHTHDLDQDPRGSTSQTYGITE